MNPGKLFVILLVCFVGKVFAGQYSEIRSYVKPIIATPLEGAGSMSGSGTVIAPGYILTVSHIIPEGSDKFNLFIGDRSIQYPIKLKVLKIDREVDLALLSGDFQCPCAPISRLPLELDQDIYSVGFPLYTKYQTQYVSTGIVEKLNEGSIVSSLTSAPGSSGGGIFVKNNGKFELASVAMSIGVYQRGPIIQLQNWITFSPGPEFIRDFLSDTPVANL